ncbi:response regulator transcription factor [Clostridium sp. CF011]|uniref:response regulator transcription factor n=1 Tax=unclassified Clostridium TaxID=2614128 RepID=UPI001C0C1FD7|nr:MULTISPECIES: response regulator transcription factor [unclassified Clostridium]MBU3093450.1 response regulator transcription factor [Clostridium sp. CF011]MBW9146170.1 response regulator transcription factor [Clostridium sp. CM027]UVE39848.1 response regulator transcription factor [Clostridium sp. CM027]WAG68757.1 response regulator transcription factor [Clostridium sp. CF011]
MEQKTILIIEDEKELAEILRDYLEIEGFKIFISFDGEEGLKLFKSKKPELVLLDIMLPKVNGMEVCKQIRNNSNIPIIMVSAKSGEMDKVISLGIGADDYVTKPFSPLELVARVKAHLRRYKELEQSKAPSVIITIGKLRISKESYEASIDEKIIDFTTKEFEVLYFFARHVNQVFSKQQIYQEVWGMNEFGDISSVAVYIKRIREKLNNFGLCYIKTVWGVGYKLSV